MLGINLLSKPIKNATSVNFLNHLHQLIQTPNRHSLIQIIPNVKSTSQQTVESSVFLSPHTAVLSRDPVTYQDGISQAGEKPFI